MADGKPEGVTDEEWAAIQAHRRDSAPKRKGTGRYTDEAGISYEFELTPEETAKLAGKALAGLFTSDDEGKKDDEGKPKKPAVLKDYFGKSKAAGS
jgi:hypothetical protein